MNEPDLFENTRIAAYFLWEYTECENALDLWLCAEEIAWFFEQTDIIDVSHIGRILQTGRYDISYICFLRHIAYRIFLFTNRPDEWHNWFAAERLVNNHEWINAVTSMSNIFRKEKSNSSVMGDVRSDNVRAYYL